MDLDALKSTWDSVSSKQEINNHISANELQIILQKKTVDISEKVARNIKTGLFILIGWIIVSVSFSFFSNHLFEDTLEKAQLSERFILWASIFEIFSYALMVSAITWFALRYNQISKKEQNVFNLKNKLKGLINTLSIYKRMFYVILLIIIIYIIATFSSAFYQTLTIQFAELGIRIQDLKLLAWLISIFSFVISLSILIGIYYILFNLFFTRLYGRYLKQLKATLKELDEVVP